MNIDRLAGAIKLQDNVKVYVPSTISVDVHIDTQAVTDSTTATLANLFGGATQYNVKGAWVAANGALVTESVTIVQSFTTPEQLEQHIDAVVSLCEQIKRDLSQEAVSLEINGSLYLI